MTSLDEALRALEKDLREEVALLRDMEGSCEHEQGMAIRAAAAMAESCAYKLAALLTTRQEVAPVAHRWLDELRGRMEHCISAADEGEDYAVPRDYLDAMTTLGLMKKVGRGKWAPTEEGEAFAERRPTLPVEIYGKFYEVPIPVQLHIVNLMDKLTSTGQTSDARDGARYRKLRSLLYSQNLDIGEAELSLHFYGSSPTLEQFDAAVDAAMRQEAE